MLIIVGVNAITTSFNRAKLQSQDQDVRQEIRSQSSDKPLADRIDDQVVRDNERLLTGGFYAEVDLTYDAAIAQQKTCPMVTAPAYTTELRR